MTIYDFDKLSEVQKSLVIGRNAKLIDQYIQHENIVLIYTLNNFFIECSADLFSFTLSAFFAFEK